MKKRTKKLLFPGFQSSISPSRLMEADQSLVARTAFLRELLAGATAPWMLEHMADLRAQIGALEAAIQLRRDLLAF